MFSFSNSGNVWVGWDLKKTTRFLRNFQWILFEKMIKKILKNITVGEFLGHFKSLLRVTIAVFYEQNIWIWSLHSLKSFLSSTHFFSSLFAFLASTCTISHTINLWYEIIMTRFDVKFEDCLMLKWLCDINFLAEILVDDDVTESYKLREFVASAKADCWEDTWNLFFLLFPLETWLFVSVDDLQSKSIMWFSTSTAVLNE